MTESMWTAEVDQVRGHLLKTETVECLTSEGRVRGHKSDFKSDGKIHDNTLRAN